MFKYKIIKNEEWIRLLTVIDDQERNIGNLRTMLYALADYQGLRIEQNYQQKPYIIKEKSEQGGELVGGHAKLLKPSENISRK